MYDTIEYILPYSFLFSIGIFCACLIYKSFFGINKVVKGFLIFSIITFFFNIRGLYYLNSTHPHLNCKIKFEEEAQNIAMAISDYFSIPTRTKIPSISDLVNSGNYISLENRDSKYKKLVAESKFSVAILDGDEIPIVVSSKVGKCPFDKGYCLWSKGEVYVLKMEGSGGGVWLDSYKEN
jgi:hypothetical protein